MSNTKIINLKLSLYFIMFMIGAQAVAQCPTVANANQEFCATPDPSIPTLRPRVADLVATDAGDGIVWYITDVGGTPLTGTVNLVNGVTYYADNDTGDCALRPSVTVSISGEAPSANYAFQVFRCSSAINTIDQLDPSGPGIEWFDAVIAGNSLPGSTQLVSGTTYYVQLTENGCISRRLPVTVTISDPAPPTGPTDQFFCFDANNPVVFQVANLTATGTEINWYISPTSTSPLDPSTPLINNRTYYATQTTFPCESSGRYATLVTIDNLPDPGVNGTLAICDSATASINLFDQLGGSPDTGGSWTGPATTTGGHLGRVDTSLFTPGAFVFTYSLAAVNACPAVSSTVTINVQVEPDAGEDNVLEICTNEPVVNLFGLLGGAPDAGGTWTGPSALTNADQGTFDPFVNTSGIYTYTVDATLPCTGNDTAFIDVTVVQAPFAGLDASVSLCANDPAINLLTLLPGADAGGTWSPALPGGIFDPAVNAPGPYTYRLDASLTCPEDESIVTVSIVPQPEAGENAATEICSDDAAIDLFALLGATADTGGTWSPALPGGLFDPAVHAAGDYTYTVAPTAPCPSSDSAIVNVTIQQAPDAGTNGTANYCNTDPLVDLFTLLGGTPDTGGTWSPSLDSGTGVFNPAVDEGNTYTYTIAATAVCGATESMVVVSVSLQPSAGDDNTIELCTNDATVDLFTVLGGTPNTGGTWSPTLDSGTGVYNPAVDAGIAYTYSVDPLGTCPGDVATVTVNLNILPNAGTDATITVCGSDVAFDLFSLLGGTPNSGGTWSGPSNVTNGQQGTFDPAANISGDYIYTSAGSGACEDVTAMVQVTIVNPLPALPIDGEIFCIADGPTIADLIARAIPEMGGTMQVYQTITSTVALAATTALIAGDTYYVTETDLATSCEGTNRLPVTIQINDPVIPQLSNSSAEFCLIDDPTVANLNAFIAQGTNVVWVDALTNGNQFSETDALVSGDYYAIEEDVNTCRSSTSTVLSIIINDNPPPTLNPNGNELCGVERPTIAELEANVTTETGLTVIWYDMVEGGTTLSTADLLIDNSTYYAATFNATTGCESNERLEITVDLTACDLNQYPLLLPDGFSPNGDNINDTYDLLEVEFLYENYTIEIYNRYGNLLYEGDISTPPWDGISNQPGTFGNEIVPNGVYFYIFNFNRNNVPPQQGRLYLNR